MIAWMFKTILLLEGMLSQVSDRADTQVAAGKDHIVVQQQLWSVHIWWMNNKGRVTETFPFQQSQVSLLLILTVKEMKNKYEADI